MNTLYLAQSDTTIGFLCQDAQKINAIKGRNKKVLIEVDSLTTLKTFSRIPKRFANTIRRSTKTTFIYPNKRALRVINDPYHLAFLKTIKWAYSSSANKTSQDFDLYFATSNADVIIQDKRGFFQAKPSKIYKINQAYIKRIR